MGGRGRGGIGAIMGLVGGGREGVVGDVNREWRGSIRGKGDYTPIDGREFCGGQMEL